MEKKNNSGRRGFLGSIGAGLTLTGLASIFAPFKAIAETNSSTPLSPDDPEAWFNQIKGKHRMAFDVTQPHEIFPFAWPRVFMNTNLQTGTPENQQSVVVVLRHKAIGYAFEDRLWAKYKMGELFGADDPLTKTAAVRNPFWRPNPGDYKVPGIGNVAIGINELQSSGVLFCVCSSAISAHSARAAGLMKLEHEDVKKDWLAGLLPNIQPVPSGVWALGRAQEHGCGYIFAG